MDEFEESFRCYYCWSRPLTFSTMDARFDRVDMDCWREIRLPDYSKVTILQLIAHIGIGTWN